MSSQFHPITPLIVQWRERAAELRRWADANGAAIAHEAAANQLELAIDATADELLTIGRAAAESGYSTDHLSSLVRQGRIPNAGRKNTPRLRRSDLPMRPKNVARASRRRYDAVADARALLSRQGDTQ